MNHKSVAYANGLEHWAAMTVASLKQGNHNIEALIEEWPGEPPASLGVAFAWNETACKAIGIVLGLEEPK